MSTLITIACPHCLKNLKIKDPSLLGKMVQCPGCRQPLRLEVAVTAPAVEKPVHIELVDEPAVGTGAHWVPDPPAQQSSYAQPPASGPVIVPGAPVIPPVAPPSLVVGTDEPKRAAASEKYLRKRKRGKGTAWIVVGIVALFVVGVVGLVASQYRPAPPEAAAEGQDSNSGSLDPSIILAEELQSATKPFSQARLEGDQELVAEFAPTGGTPIQLTMVPSGVSVIFHMRPAQLWSSETQYGVLRASLTTDVTNWLEGTIRNLCRREPTQIDELLIGLILGARGSQPQTCVVMRLKEPVPLVNLIEEFKGPYLHDDPIPRIKIDQERHLAYLIHDEQTIAICPEEYAQDLEDWIEKPNYEVPEGLTQLLKSSDRDRLFTFVGQARDLQIHGPTLFPQMARDSLVRVFDWLGTDVETVAWSMHTEPYLHSEVRLRPESTTDTQALADRFKSQLDALPTTLWKDVCLKMKPQEKRFREFIGRLPAMVEAFRQSTVMSTGHRQVNLTTVLPAKAIPNLALATMFTVNEAARTNFSEPQPVAMQSDRPKLPETVRERLYLVVDVEFNRTPLEQAFQYLCDKLEVQLAVDGDALKDAGYTKNMQQTMTLGKVPTETAFYNILQRYQEENGKMAMWIDETTKTIHITTRKFAERDNLTIYEPVNR